MHLLQNRLVVVAGIPPSLSNHWKHGPEDDYIYFISPTSGYESKIITPEILERNIIIIENIDQKWITFSSSPKTITLKSLRDGDKYLWKLGLMGNEEFILAHVTHLLT